MELDLQAGGDCGLQNESPRLIVHIMATTDRQLNSHEHAIEDEIITASDTCSESSLHASRASLEVYGYCASGEIRAELESS